MTIEELLAALTGQPPPGSHPVDQTLADLLWPVTL